MSLKSDIPLLNISYTHKVIKHSKNVQYALNTRTEFSHHYRFKDKFKYSDTINIFNLESYLVRKINLHHKIILK